MKKYIALIIIGLIVGTFVTLQSRSFKSIGDVIVGRDSHTNVFQEIQILMQTNKNLEQEILDLQDNLDQLSNRALALQAIDSEITKYRVLDGQMQVFGPGVQVRLSDNIATIWLVDLVNDLYSNGAEAVSINDVRLTNHTHGFDTLPQGQILFNGNILKTPLVVKAIGPKEVLKTMLEQPKGIVDKLYENNKGLEVTVEIMDNVEMANVI